MQLCITCRDWQSSLIDSPLGTLPSLRINSTELLSKNHFQNKTLSYIPTKTYIQYGSLQSQIHRSTPFHSSLSFHGRRRFHCRARNRPRTLHRMRGRRRQSLVEKSLRVSNTRVSREVCQGWDCPTHQHHRSQWIQVCSIEKEIFFSARAAGKPLPESQHKSGPWYTQASVSSASSSTNPSHETTNNSSTINCLYSNTLLLWHHCGPRKYVVAATEGTFVRYGQKPCSNKQILRLEASFLHALKAKNGWFQSARYVHLLAHSKHWVILNNHNS